MELWNKPCLIRVCVVLSTEHAGGHGHDIMVYYCCLPWYYGVLPWHYGVLLFACCGMHAMNTISNPFIHNTPSDYVHTHQT